MQRFEKKKVLLFLRYFTFWRKSYLILNKQSTLCLQARTRTVFAGSYSVGSRFEAMTTYRTFAS